MANENVNEAFQEVDDYTTRLALANSNLLDLYSSIKKSSDPQERQTLMKLFGETYRAIIDDSNRKEELRLREMQLELDREKFEEEVSRAERTEFSDWIKVGLNAALGISSTCASVWMFKRSTEKEKEDAYLTLTDKSTVQEGLKGRFWDKLRIK